MPISYTITLKSGKETQGWLRWPDKGLESRAISGPHGNGTLPEGLYQAKHLGFMDRSEEEAYCDSLNNCWFQYLEPQFSTSRTDLGVHPDGNVEGTAGCIGLLDSDSSEWREAFESITADVSLEVLDASNLQPVSPMLYAAEMEATTSPWPADSQIALEVFYSKHKLGTTGMPTAAWESEHLTSIKLPYRMTLPWDLSKTIGRIRCHNKVGDSLTRIFDRILKHYGSEQEVKRNRMHLFGGCFAYRPVAGGARLSTHAWGAAIDLDPDRNPLGKEWNSQDGMMPLTVVGIFEAEGWRWGGRFQNRKDCMHFQATA